MEKIELQVVMEEYKALRAEILQHFQNRNATLNFGLATLAGVVTGALVFQLLAFWIFAVVVPLISLFVLIFWILDTEEIARIGFYLAKFENKVNTAFGKSDRETTLLNWETSLRANNKIFDRSFYVKINFLLLLFSGIALSSLIFGLVTTELNIVKIVIGILIAAIIVRGIQFIDLRAREINLSYNVVYPQKTPLYRLNQWIKSGFQGTKKTIASINRLERQEVMLETAREMVIELLETRFVSVPLELISKVKNIENIAVLKQFHKQAINVASVEELEQLFSVSDVES